MKKFFDRIKNNRGMSIVEAVVAIGILSVAVIPILSIFISTAKYSAIAKVKQRATNTGMSVMENFKAYGAQKSYDKFASKTFLSGAVEGNYSYPLSGINGDYTLTKVKLSDGSDARFNVNIHIEEDQTVDNNPGVEEYEETPYYNAEDSVMFSEDPAYIYDPYYYISQYIDDNITIASTIKDNITNININRKINLLIDSAGKVVVNYDFSGSNYVSGGHSYPLSIPPVNMSAPLEASGDLKKVFFYYYPSYDFARTGYDIKDTLFIDNDYDSGSDVLQVFIIKQIDGSLDRIRLKNSENNYSLVLKNDSLTKPVRVIDVINRNLGNPSGGAFDFINDSTSSLSVEQGLSESIEDYPLSYKITIEVVDTKPLFNSESSLIKLSGTVMR